MQCQHYFLPLIIVMGAWIWPSSTCAQDIQATNGGGEIILDHQCTMHEYEDEIVRDLEEARQRLVDEGVLPPKDRIPTRRQITLLEWPLRHADGFSANDYYGISNYVDLDATSGLQDYECSARTYDGHNGIDYFLTPYPWLMMARNEVEIVASAPGVIIQKIDGNDDMHCACFGQWNAVYVEHADGSILWYGHMKTGTLTSKPIGATVSVGEYLGLVGSSGCSTGPHLHLELRDINNNRIEPYDGPCNNTTASSWWANQRPFRTPRINTLYTHHSVPQQGQCPQDEHPNLSNAFMPGDVVYYAAYYHDQEMGDVSTLRVLRPDGTVMHTFNNTSPSTYNASWWWWSRTLSSSAMEGIYTFEATYQGETVYHYFTVGCPDHVDIDAPVRLTSDMQVAADQTITTNGMIDVLSAPNGAELRSPDVLLNPGFEVKPGSQLEVNSVGCP